MTALRTARTIAQAARADAGQASATPLEVRFARTALSRQRRQLIRAILDNPKEAYFLSSRELARRYNVDAATIVRTIQALGYRALRRLRRRSARALRQADHALYGGQGGVAGEAQRRRPRRERPRSRQRESQRPQVDARHGARRRTGHADPPGAADPGGRRRSRGVAGVVPGLRPDAARAECRGAGRQRRQPAAQDRFS